MRDLDDETLDGGGLPMPAVEAMVEGTRTVAMQFIAQAAGTSWTATEILAWFMENGDRAYEPGTPLRTLQWLRQHGRIRYQYRGRKYRFAARQPETPDPHRKPVCRHCRLHCAGEEIE